MATKHFTQSAPTTAAAQIVGQNYGRESVLIQNASASVTAYLGPSGVTAATGLALAPGATITDSSTDAWYAITASGSGDLRVVDVW